jgi:hypothetical protein
LATATLHLLLPCHGGQKRSGGDALANPTRRLMPAGCCGDVVLALHRAIHAASSSDAVILGRQGGPSTTSKTEALLCSVRRSSPFLHQQVVRPRRSGRRIRSFAGSMLSTTWHRISMTTSRGRRRMVAEASRDPIAFLLSVSGC